MIRDIPYKILDALTKRLGYKLVNQKNFFNTQDGDVNEIIKIYSEITQKSFPNVNIINTKHINTIFASKYILENKILGDFVECGVFRGFNIALMICTIKHFGDKNDLNRKIFLYDTFSGMTNPSKYDYKKGGLDYSENIKKQKKFQKDTYNSRCYYPIEGVKNYLSQFEYDNLIYVKGDVMKTIPNDLHTKRKIALLRLDTDFYESTKHEIENLYDLVNDRGVVISDDYNTWEGAKKACDEFFKLKGHRPLYVYTPRSDYVWIKV